MTMTDPIAGDAPYQPLVHVEELKAEVERMQIVVDAAVALCDRLGGEKWVKPTIAKLNPLFKAVYRYNLATLKETP